MFVIWSHDLPTPGKYVKCDSWEDAFLLARSAQRPLIVAVPVSPASAELAKVLPNGRCRHLRYLRRDLHVERSLVLQGMLRSAGFAKGTGVSSEGLRWVKRLAKRRGIKDWLDVATLDEYDALIAAASEELR